MELFGCIQPGRGAVEDMLRIEKLRKKRISDLKEKIKEMRPCFKRVEPRHIQLYRVSIPTTDGETLLQELCSFEPDKMALGGLVPLYKAFPYCPPKHVHVIVRV